jgi:hypothetical protein
MYGGFISAFSEWGYDTVGASLLSLGEAGPSLKNARTKNYMTPSIQYVREGICMSFV